MSNLIRINNSLVRAINKPIINKGTMIYTDLDGNGNKAYRILKCNGNIALIMAMFDDLDDDLKWDDGNLVTIDIEGLEVAKYADNSLDTYLNTTWYNTLTSNVQNAIISSPIINDIWYLNNSDSPSYEGIAGNRSTNIENYTVSKYSKGAEDVGNRKIFIPSVQDIINYLEDPTMRIDSSTLLTNSNIWNLFWDDTIWRKYRDCLLRSPYADSYSLACCILGETGQIGLHETYSDNIIIRPTFYIDLSKISWTINAPVIAGEKWILNNENLTPPSKTVIYKINFTSGYGTSYCALRLYTSSNSIYISYGTGTADNIVWQSGIYNDGYWSTGADRVIIFETAPTGDLLTWLQANAVKQEK